MNEARFSPKKFLEQSSTEPVLGIHASGIPAPGPYVIGTKERANFQLRVVIRVLKGQCGGKNWNSSLQIALDVKEDLLERGFPWQAKQIDHWIHRLQPRKADSLKGEEREASHRSHGILPYAKSTLSELEVF